MSEDQRAMSEDQRAMEILVTQPPLVTSENDPVWYCNPDDTLSALNTQGSKASPLCTQPRLSASLTYTSATGSTESEDPHGNTSPIESHSDMLHRQELSYLIASQRVLNRSLEAASSQTCAPFNSPFSIDQSMIAPPTPSMCDALPLQAFLARFDKQSEWAVENLSKRWCAGTEYVELLLDAYKACEEGNPEFQSGDTKMFARYCERLTTARRCTQVVLRLITYRSDLCGVCKKNDGKKLTRKRKRDRRLRESMNHPIVYAPTNSSHGSQGSRQTRSALASPLPSEYALASTGSADTDRPTPPQSTYSHRNDRSDDLARQPYDRDSTANTPSHRSQWSTKHPHALPETSVDDPAACEAHPPSLRAVTNNNVIARLPVAYDISWKEPGGLEDFSRRFDGAGSKLLAQFDKYDCYNRLALLQSVKDAYENKVSFTLGCDIQLECRKCIGYGLGKNRCPVVVFRDSGNASDRCDECSNLHSLHEQWIDGRKKRATS